MWWQILAFIVAVAVTASPDVLGLGNAIADAFHVLGPLAAAIAGMAASEVLRPVRRMHLLVGGAIAAAPLLLGDGTAAIVVGLIAGAALAVLAVPGSADMDRFGGGWSAVVSPREPREQG